MDRYSIAKGDPAPPEEKPSDKLNLPPELYEYFKNNPWTHYPIKDMLMGIDLSDSSSDTSVIQVVTNDFIPYGQAFMVSPTQIIKLKIDGI